jgi:hypothetical protein
VVQPATCRVAFVAQGDTVSLSEDDSNDCKMFVCM